MPTTPRPIDFAKVESLRRHMLLTMADMATLFGVSRMTYYNWAKGGPIRKSNEVRIRVMLKKLLAVMTEHGWPTPAAIAGGQKRRLGMLLELIQ